MRLGTCLLIGGHTPQGALHKLADFCSAPVAGFYSAVDNRYPHLCLVPVQRMLVRQKAVVQGGPRYRYRSNVCWSVKKLLSKADRVTTSVAIVSLVTRIPALNLFAIAAISSQASSISIDPVRPLDKTPRLWVNAVVATLVPCRLALTSANACGPISCASAQPEPTQLGIPR